MTAARDVIARGPKVVIVTSLVTLDAPTDEIRVLAVTAEAAWTVTTPLLAFPIPLNGAGDALAATVSGLF